MASMPTNQGSGDNDDLQALFDNIVNAATTPKSAAVGNVNGGQASEIRNDPPLTAEERQESIFNKIGQMTRMLHDSLREFGYDRKLQETARAIPDARERLNYIATMTEQAASRVLNATDVAQPLQESMEADANALDSRWKRLYARELSVTEFKDLAGETHQFMGRVANDTKLTNAQLMEIMMAQDFQDLTGQVIKKIVDMAASMESELLRVLLDVMPESRRNPANDGLLNGPVISAGDDVVTDQAQVDDLLDSLGF